LMAGECRPGDRTGRGVPGRRADRRRGRRRAKPVKRLCRCPRPVDHRKRLHEDPDLLLVSVLNNWDLQRTEREMAKTARGR